jgi:hypothetical protein
MHYMMSCPRLGNWRAIAQGPGLKTEPWICGRKLSFPVPEPLLYTLGPGPGDLLPMYDQPEPLMRQDLLDALQEAGVDNLDLYRAVVRDPFTGRAREDYWGFNVLGLVASAVENPAVTIDEAKTGGLLFYRLAEVPSIIVVDETVRRAIQRRAIAGVTFDGGAAGDDELPEQERLPHD